MTLPNPGAIAGLKPVIEEERYGSQPEIFLKNAPTEDMRYYMPFNENVSMRPLWIAPTQNRWCGIMTAHREGLINRHYHPHQVFGYTISGRWSYLEYDWVAEAGDFVYETPGGSHTLIALESEDPLKIFFNVTGPFIWLDDDGNETSKFDAFDYLAMARNHYEEVGLGADKIDALMR